jgi:hypothetical protein
LIFEDKHDEGKKIGMKANRKTRRLLSVLMIAVLASALLSGCGDNGSRKDGKKELAATEQPAENATPTPAVTDTSKLTETPTPKPTKAPTVTATPTVTPSCPPPPTSTPIPTPIKDYMAEEVLNKNRELHEVVYPKREIAKRGTGPAYSEQDLKDIEYGITRNYPITTEELITYNTNNYAWMSSSYEDRGIKTVHLSGYKKPDVQSKINNRIDEVVKTLVNQAYIPNASGVIRIFEERGKPKRETSAYSHACYGYLTVYLTLTCSWNETKHFSDIYNEAWDYAKKVWPLGDYHYGYNYEMVYDPGVSEYTDAYSGNVNFQFQLYESVYLVFNLVTGEEVMLSDLFAEDEDYLGFLNDEIMKRQNYQYWEGSFEDYKENLEYDGGRLFSGIRGDEYFSIESYGNSITVYTDALKNGYITLELPNPLPNIADARNSNGSCSYSISPLERLRSKPLGDYDYTLPETVSFMLNTEDRGDVKVSVMLDETGMLAYSARDWKPVESPYALSRDVVYEASKEWAKRHCVAALSRYEGIESYTIIPDYASVYPNGYVCIDAQVNGSGENGWVLGTNFEEIWMKDGKFIEKTDIFDISYEEILKEVFTSGNVMNEEQATYCASVLSPYITGVDAFTYDGLVNLDRISFVFPDATDYLKVGEEIQQKLVGHFPEDTIERLIYASGYVYYDCQLQEFNVLRHLRMYEGYTFE